MSRPFDGRVALVTGAAGGIGLATALCLERGGASVALLDLHPDALQAPRQQVLQAGAPRAWALGCDVSAEDQVTSTVAALLGDAGRLDVIVNNAGLMGFKPLTDLSGADWLRILGVDLLGAFYFVREGLRHMPPGSAIVNVASVHAERTTPCVAPYAAAKAALLSLTRSAAIEGRERGIRTNAVLPGAVDTRMLHDNPEVKAGVEHISAAELGRPEQVGAAIAWLASPEAAFVQGAALVVDGGRLSAL